MMYISGHYLTYDQNLEHRHTELHNRVPNTPSASSLKGTYSMTLECLQGSVDLQFAYVDVGVGRTGSESIRGFPIDI